MVGWKYIDSLDQVWELISAQDGFLMWRVDDGYMEVFETLDSFDVMTDQMW